jgi:hypothetical protein
MAMTVKKTSLWKKELDNHPGAIGEALDPLAEAGADLKLVMVYRFPDARKGAVEVHPVSGRKLISIATSRGFAPSPGPVLLVEGDNRKGLGSVLTKALGDAGISVSFLMAQIVGLRYAALLGFRNDNDAAKAANLIKKAAKRSRVR